MTITINGTTGITNDGGYTGDGVVFADTTPANTLVTTTGGNVGIGTSSPAYKLDVRGDAPAYFGQDGTNGTQFGYRATIPSNSANCFVGWVPDTVAGINGDLALCPRTSTGGRILFYTGSTTPTERARIDSSGNLLVGTTTRFDSSFVGVVCGLNANNGLVIKNTDSFGGNFCVFDNSAGANAGKITHTGTTTVAYTTSSDYRLKEDVKPMTGALAKVAALKPVTYKWKVDGSGGQGFIAHELQEVEPGCVTGEKDAVDSEGKPQYQGIDTSFLVATLTAAIQEQQAIILAQESALNALTARVAALDARLTSLEGK